MEPGTTHWYTFDYDYVHTNESDDNEPSRAIATLEMATPGSVEFVVQTMERLGPWASEDEDPGHVGVGSPRYLGRDGDNDSVYSAHELIWAGSSRTSESFLIIVKGDGGYRLTVDGETVNFTQPSLDGAVAFSGMTSPSEMPDGPQTIAMASDAGEVQSETFALSIESAPAAAIMAGSQPGERSGAQIGWATVKPGESHWYRFDYDYAHKNESDDNEPSQAIATLEMANPGSVGFVVQPRTGLVRGSTKTTILGFSGVGSPLYLGRDDDHDSVHSAHELVWAGSARASARTNHRGR